MTMDFTIQTPNLVEQGLRGYQLGQGLQMQYQQNQALQAQQQRKQAYQNAMAQLAQKQNTTADDYLRLQTEFPEQMKAIQEVNAQKNEVQLQNDILDMQKIVSAIDAKKPNIAKDMLDQRIEALKNSGRENEAQAFEMMKEQVDVSPEAVMIGINRTLAASMGPEEFRKFLDQRLGRGEDKTQSSVILDDGTTIFATSGQNVKVIGPNNEELTGADAAEAIKRAKEFGVSIEQLKAAKREEGKLGAQIDTKATIAEQVKAAEKGAEVAINKSNEFVDKYEKVQQNLNTLDEGIGIIERGLKEGKDLGVGPIRKYFPRWGATANELRNVTNRMGLDIVTSVTFGALSESELKMALDTAMPTNLRGEALLKWMKDRKRAQEKYADYLSRAARFIGSKKADGTINTVQDWMNVVESKKKKPASNDTRTETTPLINDLKQSSSSDLFKRLQQTMGQ